MLFAGDSLLQLLDQNKSERF